MSNTPTQAVVVYCSPAGTTRRVARVIEDALAVLDVPCTIADIGTRKGRDSAGRALARIGASTCLFVGSPVYVNHAVPPVTDLIDRLPGGNGAAAVPFVTWGGASSGVALYEMGKALVEKGFRLAGAAKVLAVHSMLWQSRTPVGHGRPNHEDELWVRRLVETVVQRLRGEGPVEGPVLQALDYQPHTFRDELAAGSLEKAKAHLPVRTVLEERCTQCGICAEVCPTDAVSLSPFPSFNSQCICCFNCVRECPEDAVDADLSQTEGMIRKRRERLNEQPDTQIFL